MSAGARVVGLDQNRPGFITGGNVPSKADRSGASRRPVAPLLSPDPRSASLRSLWLEDGIKRWNVWNATDELRVLELRLESICDSARLDGDIPTY